jgi:hypothetical protein
MQTHAYACSELPVWLPLHPKRTDSNIESNIRTRAYLRLTMTLRRLVQFPMLSTEHEIADILDLQPF